VLDVVLEELSQQQQEELPFRITAEPAQKKENLLSCVTQNVTTV
jgi:hypothetical protein